MDYQQETAWDLRLNLLGTPIRVHPMFWIVTAFLGWNEYTSTNDLSMLLIWIMAVFFSILVHELGHVFMGKYFGTHGYIILHGFGGVAIGSNNLSNRWKRIAVTLAGPGIQLLLYAFILFLLELRVIPQEKNAPWVKVNHFVRYLLYINLYWPILNLLPVFPLDGGQALRDFLSLFLRSGDKITYTLSIIVSVLMIVYFAKTENFFMIFLFIMMAMQNIELFKRA
jgi:stage IV sporulation protein FB